MRSYRMHVPDPPPTLAECSFCSNEFEFDELQAQGTSELGAYACKRCATEINDEGRAEHEAWRARAAFANALTSTNSTSDS